MSEVVESCGSCGWSSKTAFVYHGGLPIEHPICPSCGGELAWTYGFAAREVPHAPDAMAAFVTSDEAGFPEDGTPEYAALGALLDEALERDLDEPLRIMNVQGVVDIELRPYVHSDPAERGAKLIANVGQAVYAMALLELLAQINHRLEVGQLIAHPSPYGLPHDAHQLFPFGTPVGLYMQAVVGREALESGVWVEAYDAFVEAAVALAHQLASTARLAPSTAPAPVSEPPLTTKLISDEFVPSLPVQLENVRQAVLEPLLEDEHPVEVLLARLEAYHEALELAPGYTSELGFHYTLDSAQVRVWLETHGGRLLVRYRAVVLSRLPLDAEGRDAEEVARLLTTLNDQIVFGKCVLEPLGDGAGQIVLDKTLLGLDLDLSEFAVTLAAVAEEADRIDNRLQEGLGGLRADQRPEAPEVDAAPLEPLLQKLATRGLPGFERIGVEEGRRALRHLLEEVRLDAEEDAQGDLWFTYGSSRILGRVWGDDRATYVTLRATVLQDVEHVEGLAQAINGCNRVVHVGAFALSGDRTIEMVETILIDDLSIEEFMHALVTLGEFADLYDNILQDRFGGLLGTEAAAGAG